MFALVCERRSKKKGSGDSVSPIIITANHLAAGWASDPDGDSLYSRRAASASTSSRCAGV
jgi:hypothetical protein